MENICQNLKPEEKKDLISKIDKKTFDLNNPETFYSKIKNTVEQKIEKEGQKEKSKINSDTKKMNEFSENKNSSNANLPPRPVK